MIVSMAIVSHSPLILPYIQKKESDEFFVSLLAAYQELEGRLYQKKPDTLVFISPHSLKEKRNFLINFHPSFKISFPHFGDFENYGEFSGESVLTSLVTSHFRTREFPLSTFSSPLLDYGTGIPLTFFVPHLRETRILPLYTSEQLPNTTHKIFGEELLLPLDESTRRVAIIVSIDLQHNTSQTDETFLTVFKENNFNRITDIDTVSLENIKACSYKPLFLLSGLLKEKQYHSETLFYDTSKESNILMALLHV